MASFSKGDNEAREEERLLQGHAFAAWSEGRALSPCHPQLSLRGCSLKAATAKTPATDRHTTTCHGPVILSGGEALLPRPRREKARQPGAYLGLLTEYHIPGK